MNYKVIYLLTDSALDILIVELLPKSVIASYEHMVHVQAENKAIVHVHTCKQNMFKMGQR